ncbi:MAG: hypothetical protein ACE5FU_10995 [Nitrospinota bacterium]
MNVGNEEREDYEDEMFSKGGTIAEIELPEVDFGPPIPLSAPLNQLLKGQLHEYSSLKDTLKHAEEIVRKRKLEREEKKKKEDAELLLRNPEYTLKTLHQIIRNPDVVQYLENIGDIIVFELERGMGKNIILFSKIDHRTEIK